MRLHFHDELLDGQLLRAIGHATYGGAEVGECLAAAARIDPRDRESWRGAWMELADRTFALAEATGERRAYLRASNYYRTAYVLHLEAPLPAVALDAYRRQRDAFVRARVAEPMRIDLDGVAMPAYFCSAGAGRRPVVVAVGGYDSTAEENYFWNAAAANERGYHAVIFDGPGQGGMLFEHGRTFRADWTAPIAAVLDATCARDDVDPARIVVWGESFGGYLVPRAAAHDARIAACVLDPPQLGLRATALARVPGPARWKAELPDGPRWLVAVLRRMLDRRARSLTGGWALRRGMLTHGAASPWDYFADALRFDQPDVVPAIRCPTLVCDAADDDLSAGAKAFHDALACDKGYLRFASEDGAGAHCAVGARGVLHERAYAWLAPRLAHSSATPRGSIASASG